MDFSRESALAALSDWLSIPSVSADPAFAPDVRRAALWLQARLERAKFTVELIETAKHPVVFASRFISSDRPTVLVYGHYDVQPPDPLEEWTSPPFVPTVRDGFLYARGASDDKGQVLAHVLAAEQLQDELPVNLIFLVEGEEEIGSPNLEPLLVAMRDRLRCDAVVVSDGAMFAPSVPTMTLGLRGLAYFELQVFGPARDLHSGVYGGAVANPLEALVRLLASLKDENGRILVPGVYERVREPGASERAAWRDLPFDEAEFAASVGVSALSGEPGYSVLERLWARPSLDIHGLWGGYAGEGPKTVLPSRAGAKFSLRLVPDQDPEEIAELVARFLEAQVPPGVRLEVRALHGAQPASLSPDEPAVRAAARAIERAHGQPVRFTRAGGSIPIVATFQRLLGAPVLLVDMGLPDDGLHGPNERFSLDCFFKGIEVAKALLPELALELQRKS